MQNLRNIIRQLAQPDGETVALVCTVDAVDKSARTIDCSPINESAPLLGVNLQANQGADFGLCLFPEIGSFVVVGFIADGSAGVVLLTEKIESAEIVITDTSAVMDANGVRIETGDISAQLDKNAVTFNGGSLGGLVKVEDLTKRLNLIENDINNLKNVFTSWVVAPQDGGAALKTAATSWAGLQLSTTQRNDYENIKVKQ
ncbi:MAG: hypothetical protein HDS66_07310 [Bacteroidales bacterium]|nr:hypothetical protein [Bacteroidales bacterium]